MEDIESLSEVEACEILHVAYIEKMQRDFDKERAAREAQDALYEEDIVRLMQERNVARAALAAREAEVGRLREALKPFADAIRMMTIHDSAMNNIVVELGIDQITWRHFYQAMHAYDAALADHTS